MKKLRFEEQAPRQGLPRAQLVTSQLTSLHLFSFTSVFDFLKKKKKVFVTLKILGHTE